MDRSILRLALPSILTNIVVPLLGLMDLAISGHLGSAVYIGAIAVGAMMFNLTYWNFGFLRMGTSGMTAQAYGSGDTAEATRTLIRSLTLALGLGLAIIAVQFPLQWVLLHVISPGSEVMAYARRYFYICVWGAPAMLATMSLSGWFLGMQNSFIPMTVSITVNIVNIVASLSCVFLLGMGFYGVAAGTLISQWAGLLLGLWLLVRFRRRNRMHPPDGNWKSAIRSSLRQKAMRRFFHINGDIFLRSLCLMLISLFFTSAGARHGDLTLAVNALIMQLYLLFSYFLDGFAFAGEALAGRYAGAGNRQNLRQCIQRLFVWGTSVMAVFAIAYGAGGKLIMSLLTDDLSVLACAADYRWWAAAIPVAGMAAFVWDGVYVGLTATRQMLTSLLISTAVFFALAYGLPALLPDIDSNNLLWLGFIASLAMRSVVQTLLAPRLLRRI